MQTDRAEQVQDQDLFSGENPPASRTRQMDALVRALAANYKEFTRVKSTRGLGSAAPGTDLVGSDLALYSTWLTEAHKYFREAAHQDLALTLASEWVLDNYYVIRQTIREIQEDLPAGYFKQLPKLINGPLKGYPRIYAIARDVLAFQHHLLNPLDLQTILIELQEQIPLTMGELWALPIFLRYGLIESLAHTLEWVIRPQNLPRLPAVVSQLPGIGGPMIGGEVKSRNTSGEGPADETIANIIQSLRSITDQTWNDFFETVSSIEQILREDPAGIYPLMDFKTRDLYRKEIEKLSFVTGLDEKKLAEITREIALKGHPQGSGVNPSAQSTGVINVPVVLPGIGHPADSLRTHVGYYLLGEGRAALEERVGYKPEFPASLKRWVLRHASLVYISGNLLLTVLLAGLALLAADLPDRMVNASALQWVALPFMVIALLIATLSVSTNLVNWIVTLLLPPSILPKLDFKDEIPVPFRTLVVIPAMITRHEEIEDLVHQLELHYLRNPEPGLLFALLTDFKDADSETLPEDEALVKDASDRIEALNAKYERVGPDTYDSEHIPGGRHGRGALQDVTVRPFFFLHRKRIWNPSERKWMGWERKRGKLNELNRLLRSSLAYPVESSTSTTGSLDQGPHPGEGGAPALPGVIPGLSFSTLTGGDLGKYRPSGGSDGRENPMGKGLLQSVQFVITLDADSILPPGAAHRLVGSLAHPLNRAVYDENTGQVISGYTVLQPRMEIHPRSANHSWFTRIFAGDTGLDLYTLAVSDAYQDLFGEGIYVGKGIYNVDDFERSVDQHIPENSVLSHDLLEGLMGRAALVTDITMIEDYPSNYFIQVLRMRRWIRGDWQLLPWLIQPGRFKVNFSAIDRWKLVDNLQRAMFTPMLLTLFLFGLIALPGLAGLWTALVLLFLGIPLITSTARAAIQMLGGELPGAAFRPLGWNLMRWLLAVTFLPYEAYISLDAILTTLYRLLISHRNLLRWTTAAQTAHLFGTSERGNFAWQKLSLISLLTIGLAAGIQLFYGVSGKAAPAFIYATPVLLLWLLSPFIVRRINQPIIPYKVPLTEEQTDLIRQVTRRTWGFFERFVGPSDNWLPPDHFQESPVGKIAHSTSPTNMGLLLTSTLAAYDLGYLDQLELVTRLTTTIDTFDNLERFRGHFLNWYDTLTLQPLHPRYISSVDSGNLAACLIIISQACQAMPREALFRWELWRGYLDTLASLTDTLVEMRKPDFDQQAVEIIQRIAEMRAAVLDVQTDTHRWYALYQRASGPFWQDISKRLMELVAVGHSAFTLEMLRKLQEVTAQVERHHIAVQRTIRELVPWIPLVEQVPERLRAPQFSEALAALLADLALNPELGQIERQAKNGAARLSALRDLLSTNSPQADPVNELARRDPGGNTLDTQAQTRGEPFTPEAVVSREFVSERDQAASRWLDELDQALAQAAGNACALLERYEHISARTEQFISDMDFVFLYNQQRRVFHLGYNLDTGQLDHNFYDLLASEARITSMVAIAKGDVPETHWLHMSRPVTQIEGMHVLLSWSATMFEYLMPPLFLHSYPGTLLADSAEGAVLHQIAYGKSKGVPWGISESGFHRFDADQNYQYRAFGVPGLGFKRGLGDDVVIAPYASLMAIDYNPRAVAQNLADLIAHKSYGVYGFYEAIDFTTERLLIGEPSAVVREYMSHHQGMILMAVANYFHSDIMVKRMHSDPRIQAVELLLQEQVPLAVPVQNPYAEDVKGVQRMAAAPIEINPWNVPVQTSIPQVHLLSNGSYSVLLSNMGGGYSTWRDVDLTRWQSDGVRDPWGTWIYIQDMDPARRALWSVGFQPILSSTADIQVTYFAHMAVFRRTENDIISTFDLTVSPDDPVEIRRVHLHNNTDQPRRLRLTSYGEVILTQQAGDTRHPAFNKLFIESEYVAELGLQIFKRRARSNQEPPVFMGHMLVNDDNPHNPSQHGEVRHEADRYRFIGRGRTTRAPEALESEDYLSGATGATLDPIFALGQEVELGPHGSADLAYLTLAGESRNAILNLAARYRSWNLVDRVFQQAYFASQTWLGRQGFHTQTMKDTLQILSAMLYPHKSARASAEMIAANRMGQPGLWRFGISGDYPILLVEIEDSRQIELIREVLQIHRFLRSRRFMLDVVVLNCQQIDYGAELKGMLFRLISQTNSEQWLNQRGGIFVLYVDQINSTENILLKTVARVNLNGSRGLISAQVPDYATQVFHLPELTPTRPVDPGVNPDDGLPVMEPVLFPNGRGGFSADGCEYVIDLPSGSVTPAPWVNVIGYPHFGFMVSESGSQCSWAINSGENRLTPWSNDPVVDPSGEALYLRDEETGEVWSPTPLPAGAGLSYRVTHGAGYTTFLSHSHGLSQTLTVFASPEDPVKVIHLKLENTRGYNRRVTATQYIEWVLGTTHAASLPYIVPEYDPAQECLMASNSYNLEFGERVAFMIASKAIHGLTADRTEFIGRGGTPAFPIALRRIGLETRVSAGEDSCGVLQLHIDLQPGRSEEVYFIVGQGQNREQALTLAAKYHNPAYVGAAWERTRAFWNRLLETVQVHTPEPSTDLMLNRWLLYQSLSCRIWGRTAFYQTSGAFGFRDQLQDILALLPVDPGIARDQILNAARHQFEAGDVMHWWHPPVGRGVRTRISDDLLWLPYCTALYIEVTGDTSILAEKVPYLQAPLLKEGEHENYGEFPLTAQSSSLLEHCVRAIEKGATVGPHRLPLIGTGDWNDGLNLVGIEGRGESIWLAWFLCDVLQRFAVVVEQQGDAVTASLYRERAKEYAAAVENTAWDGAWYQRATYDDGAPLGSKSDSECQIDSIAQSWAVLSGAGDPVRARQAMQSVVDRLVRPHDRLILLFTPPFDKTPHDPGYIKGYLPGTRENGGQYTHAAIWGAWAFASLGDGARVGELFNLLNPIFQSDTPEKSAVYRVEPYAVCADIYSTPPYVRRGGWTWYTGSADWMYRLGIDGMLGFHKVADTLRIDPVIPPQWDGFEITYRFGAATYQIAVHNRDHIAHGVRQVTLDGTPLAERIIPLLDDGKEHPVVVEMGK